MSSKSLSTRGTQSSLRIETDSIFESPFAFLLDSSVPRDFYYKDFKSEGEVRRFINESKRVHSIGKKEKIVPINEMTRKEILKGADKARIARSKKLEYTHYLGVSPKRGWIKFETASQYTRGKKYTQLIKLKEAKDMRYFKEFKKNEVIKLFLNGDLQVSCSCPDFKYRHRYHSWKDGYGLYKELRYPHIRNPYLEGTVCKHLILCLTFMLNNQMSISRDMSKSDFFKRKFEDEEYLKELIKKKKPRMSNRGKKVK